MRATSRPTTDGSVLRVDDVVRAASVREVDRRKGALAEQPHALIGVAHRVGRDDDVVHRSSGLSDGVGSCSNTSSAAAAIRLDASASVRAASSTTGPRAVLMKNAWAS